jgi:hypothetical protein
VASRGAERVSVLGAGAAVSPRAAVTTGPGPPFTGSAGPSGLTRPERREPAPRRRRPETRGAVTPGFVRALRDRHRVGPDLNERNLGTAQPRHRVVGVKETAHAGLDAGDHGGSGRWPAAFAYGVSSSRVSLGLKASTLSPLRRGPRRLPSERDTRRGAARYLTLATLAGPLVMRYRAAATTEGHADRALPLQV